MQKDSTKFAECDIMEKEKCRLQDLFSSMTTKEKQDVLAYAERLLSSRKE